MLDHAWARPVTLTAVQLTTLEAEEPTSAVLFTSVHNPYLAWHRRRIRLLETCDHVTGTSEIETVLRICLFDALQKQDPDIERVSVIGTIYDTSGSEPDVYGVDRITDLAG